MAIDINCLRGEKGGDVGRVLESERRRGRSGSLVQRVIETDNAWRRCQFDQEQLAKEGNALAKQIATLKKKDPKTDVSAIVAESAALKKKLPELEASAQTLLVERNRALERIGNFVHDSVVVSSDEADNLVLRTWGCPQPLHTFTQSPSQTNEGSPKNETIKATDTPSTAAATAPAAQVTDVCESAAQTQSDVLPHYEVIKRLAGVEMKKANEIAGHRGYFLTGYGAMLNQALFQYGQSFLRSKGYTTVQPPFFMRRDWMTRVAELKDFEETLYRIPANKETDVTSVAGPAGKAKKDAATSTPSGAGATADKLALAAAGNTTSNSNSTGSGLDADLFLIATSEQPLCALHANENLDKELPIKYAGVSTCFRKEAGSSGKDMRGIFRIHQFEKVEQFVICDPKDSWKFHDEMIAVSEEFYQSLGIPYRVVSIVAGALNDAAARKYDLEAWFPSYNDYRELVSCSNCLDYQSRDLNIRHGQPKMGEREKAFVHMLNGTLCATERTMCCLLEHYQTADGIIVPEKLQRYMDGLTFLPYAASN